MVIRRQRCPDFTRAQQLGATKAMIGCDRGLAYDLLGQQAAAQADYRAAMNGSDGDKARRRMALSLAISGDKAGALDAIAPLSAKGDSASPRVRAFVLALTGDPGGAMRLINAAMPGSSASVAPFVQRLASLAADKRLLQSISASFPILSNSVIASTATSASVAAPLSPPSSVQMAQSVISDRLAGIDALLRAPSASPRPAQPALQPSPVTGQPQPKAVRAAYSPEVKSVSVQRLGAPVQAKIWLQLASGHDAGALSGKFQRLKSENPDMFDGIPGYVAENSGDARLVIGPFRGASDASIFADDLRTIGVAVSRWTNSATDRIVQVAAE